jgi:tetratricopeptide (TPR) repeat protein
MSKRLVSLKTLSIFLLYSISLTHAEYQPRFIPLSSSGTTEQKSVPITAPVSNIPHTIVSTSQVGSAEVATPVKNDKQDPVELFNQATQLLQSGKVDEAIEQYKLTLQHDASIPQAYFNLGIAYTTKNNVQDAIDCFTKAIEHKADYTKAHLQLAKALQKKGLTSQAAAHYERVLELEPQNAEARQAVASIYSEEHKFDQAIAHLRETVRLKPDNVDAVFSLANALNTAHHTQEALVYYFQCLTKRPENTSIMYNIAYTLKKLGRLAEAMPFYSAVLEKEPNHASAHFSRGLAYLVTGDWERGWSDYEWRWKQEGKSEKPRGISQSMWNGSDVRGKTVFLHSEQGLGDTFQFIRYAQLIKKMGATIIVSVQPALKDIISQCPYIDKVISMTEPNPQFDEHAPLLSLPLILKTTPKTVPSVVPYLFAKQELITQWRDKLAHDKNFRIGICWQGNDKYSTSFLRAAVKAKSMSLATLFPLSKVPGITLYNLQKETGTDQLQGLPSDFNLVSFDADFDGKNGRFMDTAAVIMNLDLVISIDTSICHIAAGLGVPTWNMLPNPPDWRWMLERTDTPWYKNMKLFRQPRPGDWENVMQEIIRELPTMVSQKEYIRLERQNMLKTINLISYDQKKGPASPPVAQAIESLTRKTIAAEYKNLPQEPLNQEQRTIQEWASSKKSPENLHELVDELTNINTKLYALGTTIQGKNYSSPLDDGFVENVRKFYVLSQMRSIVKEKIGTLTQPKNVSVC